MKDNDERPFDGDEDRRLWEVLEALDGGSPEVSEDFADRVVAAARRTPQERRPRVWRPRAWAGAATAAAAALVVWAVTTGDPSGDRPGDVKPEGGDLAAVLREIEELPEEDVLALEAETAVDLHRDWLGG